MVEIGDGPIPVPGVISEAEAGNATFTAVAIIGGVTRGSTSRAFRKANLVAVMGGLEIDLRHAEINGEASIDVFSLWGGIEIRVPEDWTVDSQVIPILGGVEDKTRPTRVANHRLIVRGSVVMAGVEIKN
jgi:predicted membrane protein